jgi:CheY-like chemotaxis protein
MAQTAPRRAAPSKGAPVDGEGPRVLVVDDNEAGRYVTSRILTRAGYAVIEASTGAEALRRAAEEQPRLVVLDVHLPDIDGYEVCRRLKGDPATAGLLVVYLTATSEEAEVASGCEQTEAEAYLTEPLRPEELLDCVARVLAGASSG